MAWVAIESQILKLKDYVLMQCIKEDSTFKVSPKGNKPSPRIVYRYGKQDGEIRLSLLKRQKIWNIMREMCTQKKGENFRMDLIVCYDLLLRSQIRLESMINNTFNRMNQYVDASEQRQGSCCSQKPTQILWRCIVLRWYQ